MRAKLFLLPLVVAFLALGCTDQQRTAEDEDSSIAAAESDPADEPDVEPDKSDEEVDEAPSGRSEGSENDTSEQSGTAAPRDLEAETDAMIACIEAEGYAVRREGMSFRVLPTSEDDLDRQGAIIDRCVERHSGDPPDTTPEWWGRMYDAQLEAAECLREQGVDVPDPPSREAFIEDPDWFPHAYAGQIAGYSAAEARQLEEACPQPQVE